MKRCKICGQICDDAVKFCPACGNREFMEEEANPVQEEQGGYTFRTDIPDREPAGPQPSGGGQNVEDGSRHVEQGDYHYANQNPYGNVAEPMQPGGYQNYSGQNQAYQTAGGRPLTKKEFYRQCVPQKLKSDLRAGYVILWLNIVVFSFLGIWYEEPARFIDVGMLLLIFIGLAATKHVAFAILDTVYFIAGAVIALVEGQRVTGYLALIVAIALIPTTSKIGKLWKQYKASGVYTPVTEPVKKKNPVLIVIVIIFLIACAGGGVYYLSSTRETGSGSFQEGTWDGQHYVNEFMNLEIDIPESGSWEIADEDELEEYNEEAEDEAVLGQGEQFDCMVVNYVTGDNLMIIHLKSSVTEDMAYKSIQNNLVDSYEDEYGGTPVLIDSGERFFAGQNYRFMKYRVTIQGVSIYQEVFVKKIGKEICEIGITGFSEEKLTQMEGFFSSHP